MIDKALEELIDEYVSLCEHYAWMQEEGGSGWDEKADREEMGAAWVLVEEAIDAKDRRIAELEGE